MGNYVRPGREMHEGQKLRFDDAFRFKLGRFEGTSMLYICSETVSSNDGGWRPLKKRIRVHV